MTKDKIIRILGVPFNGDGTTPAEENPAAALRLAGITDFRPLLNWKVEDLGDIEIPAFSGIRDPDTSVLNFNEWKDISRRTAERMKFILDDAEFLIVLGGGLFHLIRCVWRICTCGYERWLNDVGRSHRLQRAHLVFIGRAC